MEPVLDARLAGVTPGPGAVESKSTASWSAIIAGAFVAAAVSLILLALGSGLGFALISPWDGQGVTLTTFAVSTAIWFIIMQWVSSALGGYIAGRLRTRWPGTASCTQRRCPFLTSNALGKHPARIYDIPAKSDCRTIAPGYFNQSENR